MAAKCASKTLFVGNLHASLEETDLLDIFRPFGHIVECCKRWCHYGFIQFATDDEANLAFNNLNGSKVRGRPMRIEFQRKKMRNLQALLDADPGMHYGSQSPNGLDLLSFLQQQNNCDTDYENINPMLSSLAAASSLTSGYKKLNESFDTYYNHLSGAINAAYQPANTATPTGFDEYTAEPALDTHNNDEVNQILLEQCLLHVFEEILFEEKLDAAVAATPEAKKESNSSNVLKTISLNCLEGSRQLKASVEYNSISPSCSSPLSLKDDDISSLSPSLKFPALNNSKGSSKSTSSLTKSNASSSSSSYNTSSVMLFRSINSSNTIYVQPSDIIVPLNESDYNEYKLFPAVDKASDLAVEKDSNQLLEKIFNNLGAYSVEEQLYSPPMSASPTSTRCSSVDSNSSSLNASPINTASPFQHFQRSSLLTHHHHHHHQMHSPLGQLTTIRPSFKYLLK